jgi:hypothetical protein
MAKRELYTHHRGQEQCYKASNFIRLCHMNFSETETNITHQSLLPLLRSPLSAISPTSTTAPSLKLSSCSSLLTAYPALHVALSRSHPYSHNTFSPQQPPPLNPSISTATISPAVVASRCKLLICALGSATMEMQTSICTQRDSRFLADTLVWGLCNRCVFVETRWDGDGV